MTWSKVKKGRKPIRWWYHKICAEAWYTLEMNTENSSMRVFCYVQYHKHLEKCCEQGFNLYGEKWNG